MSALIYRKAFDDPTSLRMMMRGEIPKMEDIKRRIFITERRSEPAWPDHFIKNHREQRIGALEHTHELARNVLSSLAKRFIIRLDGKLRIRSDQFHDWQELLPCISPLAVAVMFLVEEGKGQQFGKDPRPFLAQQLGATALLAPFQPTIEAMVERDGLNELHMHLNGSTEADLIWADAMLQPIRFWGELRSELANGYGGVLDEFYDQIEIDLRPTEFRHRLTAASYVRHYVADTLRQLRLGLSTDFSRPKFLQLLRTSSVRKALPRHRHPADVIFGQGGFAPLIQEAALLYALLQALTLPQAPHDTLGLALYFHQLVQRQVIALSVQQTDQVGFDQFQKITYVGVRSNLERKYTERFRQLNRAPPYRTLTHLEGRFAPKDDLNKLLKLIEDIIAGYLAFRNCPSKTRRPLTAALPGCVHGHCNCGAKVGRADAVLSLVAHFIKTKDKRRAPDQILFSSLRNSLIRQARTLAQALKWPGVRDIMRGMDAASNELHAPPEVFGPTFRFLRTKGIDRTTYHAGEDFVHLVSGIRATDEALSFLPLQEGDRIGHAIALGIDPKLWINWIGSRMAIECTEHLDNMVYAFTRLAGTPHAGEALRLQEPIAKLAQILYGEEVQIATLEMAWKMRKLDMLLIFQIERQGADLATIARRLAGHAAGDARRKELEMIAESVERHPHAYKIMRKRHRLSSEKLAALEDIDTDWISAPALTFLQADMLKRLADGRVAIETLPSSNVRISFYRHYREHHLFRWLGLSGEPFEVMPDVCVGSDDTGIFATNLQNEYALLFETLCRDFRLTPRDATAKLEQLNRNGFAHRFAPLQGDAL